MMELRCDGSQGVMGELNPLYFFEFELENRENSAINWFIEEIINKLHKNETKLRKKNIWFSEIPTNLHDMSTNNFSFKFYVKNGWTGLQLIKVTKCSF